MILPFYEAIIATMLSSSMAVVNKAWSMWGKKSLKCPNRSILSDFETSQMPKTFSSIISVRWSWQVKFSSYLPISISNKMQTPPSVPVFNAVVSEDLDVITQSFIHAVNNRICHCDRSSIMKFGDRQKASLYSVLRPIREDDQLALGQVQLSLPWFSVPVHDQWHIT